jgi:hypothetical protein
MKKYSDIIFKKVLCIAVAGFFLTACEKQHLQPDVMENPQPLAYISAVLGTDSVYYAAGIDSYIGSTWMADTGSSRYFCFYLYNTLSSPLQPERCFKIYVNNAALNPGNPDTDLDSTIVADSLSYQNYSCNYMPSAVTIEWYDSTGAQFSSTAAPQSGRFVITSVEDVYFGNEIYKKATVEFDCILMDNTFNFIPLTNGRATLLFGADPLNPWRPDASITNIN